MQRRGGPFRDLVRTESLICGTVSIGRSSLTRSDLPLRQWWSATWPLSAELSSVAQPQNQKTMFRDTYVVTMCEAASCSGRSILFRARMNTVMIHGETIHGSTP